MPTRIIREGILTSARINSLSFMAELFYRRLMTVADDYGRYHASPATLRGACFPTCPDRVTEKQISGWINECLSGDSPLISMYESMGCRYLQIDRFGQQTRGKSKFPEPTALNACLATDKQMLTNDNQLLSLVGVVVEGVGEVVYASPKNGSSNGHRLDQTEISEDMLKFSIEDLGWETSHAKATFQRFRDYWIAKAGAGARKANWLATWRYWCREEDSRAARPVFNGKKPMPTIEELFGSDE